ncbi:MAG TPA: gamma-glutamylcyclotransferase family protein, partial [Pseudolabrys sp.]|nr:gamma-glutamylcyclotransferase family protein [Pseudolabrys sp.]
YFAYGSNMHRAGMAARCAGAQPLSVAQLAGWRFVIGTHGYASIVPAPGSEVIGVLWWLTPRDLAALNAYESLDSGLYGRRLLMVRQNGVARSALVYVGRASGKGRARPGYLELILAAARDWQMPERYIRGLRRWAPARLAGTSAAGTGSTA